MPAPSSRNPLHSRFRPLAWFAIVYLLLGALTRIVLLAMSGSGVPHAPRPWLDAFGIGLAYDLVTLLYLSWPLGIYLWLMPEQRPLVYGAKRWLAWLAILMALDLIGWAVLHALWHASLHDAWPLLLPLLFILPLPALAYQRASGRWAIYLLSLMLVYLVLFVALAELVFWQEFSTRFNFIAVDYLIYTTEVIGNIRESYPIGTWLTLLALAAILIVWFSRRWLNVKGATWGLPRRSLSMAIWLALTVLSLYTIDSSSRKHSRNNYVNELAGNGIYQFFAAFRSSHLDYDRFYRTLPEEEAFRLVREALQTPDAHYLNNDPTDLTRQIDHPGPEKRLNVVLISVESLSADFLGAFGASHGQLTPHLDALARQSLFFDRVYANGTRTVRGLEALSLSVPPTPGDSILKEPHNEGLRSLADIFNEQGYVSEFVYGGYGYFDNMNAYFGHNGYRTIDRRAIPSDMPIHAENVWGVADEDLYSLALREMDAVHQQGKPFFLHIMTTSNHRPFTFPAGRVNEPNGTREGAIAYTDWSIDDFLKRARQRPYFDDTVFVITADHDASSAGRASIPINRYHIPLWIYAPKYFPPRHVESLMGQLDIPPTLLGLLNFTYRSRFFGYDIFNLPPNRQRAFPATYEKLGYLNAGLLSILEPGPAVEQLRPNLETGDGPANQPPDRTQIDQASAFYQVASELFKRGGLKNRPSDAMTANAPAAAAPAPAAATSSAATP